MLPVEFHPDSSFDLLSRRIRSTRLEFTFLGTSGPTISVRALAHFLSEQNACVLHCCCCRPQGVVCGAGDELDARPSGPLAALGRCDGRQRAGQQQPHGRLWRRLVQQRRPRRHLGLRSKYASTCFPARSLTCSPATTWSRRVDVDGSAPGGHPHPAARGPHCGRGRRWRHDGVWRHLVWLRTLQRRLGLLRQYSLCFLLLACCCHVSVGAERLPSLLERQARTRGRS